MTNKTAGTTKVNTAADGCNWIHWIATDKDGKTHGFSRKPIFNAKTKKWDAKKSRHNKLGFIAQQLRDKKVPDDASEELYAYQ